MKKILLYLIAFTFCLHLSAQKDTDIIVTIDGEEIPVSDFKYVYEKNNPKEPSAYTKESLEKSMQLFVNYRLKVKEAESLKKDTNAAFINEFNGYKKQLAKPYLTEEGSEERLTLEAYERMKTDVNTSHILFTLDEYAAPEDTLKTYNKALQVRKRILAGEDFGQLAIENSEDPSAQMPQYKKGYKGYLGYNPAFSFVYAYETASYNTKIGDVSMPVRSKFGYHLIKVNEIRENQGQVQVAHIMIDAKDGIDETDSIAKVNLAEDLYTKLNNGGNWDELCKEYSADKRTANTGGVMQPFLMDGKMRVPAFEKSAFALKNVGDISKPVKSPYGWHIQKLIKKIPLASYEELQPELLKKVKRSDRISLNNDALIKRLKKENQFTETKDIKTTLAKYADSTLKTYSWKKPSKFDNLTVFTLNEDKFTLDDFFTYLESNQIRNNKITSASYLMSLAYEAYVDQTVYDYEEEHLASKNEDYRLLLKEFRDGILFFDLMEEEVWNKASNDTAGIRAYYESNIHNYQREKSVDAIIYKVNSRKTLNELIDSIKAGTNEVLIKKHFNKESALNLKIDKGIYPIQTTDVIKKLNVKKKTHKISKRGNYMYVIIKEVIPSGAKPLEKCRGLVISNYQTQIEKEWLDSLRKKYTVTINQEILNKLAQ